jgi:UDP-glucose 4-epimerase
LVTDGAVSQGGRLTAIDEFGSQLAGKQVLVTGATGFIGSHMVRELAALGAQVTAVGPALGWRPTVPQLVAQRQLRFVQLKAFWSTASLNQVESEFRHVEYVIHLAYAMPRAGRSLENSVDEVQQNVLGTLRLIQRLPDSVSRICFASSAMVYGPSPPRPASESARTRPVTDYAAGKLATEAFLQVHAESGGIPISVLRYATVYGPMETVPRAIPNFVRQVLRGEPPVIYGTGNDTRDYVHVTDVVDATTRALTCNAEGFQVYNVGTGVGHTTREIAERIIRLTGRGVEPIHRPAKHLSFNIVCDISHARRALGYAPKVELTEGLKDEIAYFANQPELRGDL